MTREAARVDITTAMEAANTAWNGIHGYKITVDWENKDLVDFASEPHPYAALDIVYYDGEQLDLSNKPLARMRGHIALMVCVKNGLGTSEANKIMDFFSKALHYKDFDLVHTHVQSPQPSVPRNGWWCLVTMIDFWYNELA